MKRKVIAFAVVTAALLVLALNIPYVTSVKAEDNSLYTIEWVNHTVEVMNNGYIFINDTIKINGTAPEGFLIGFPYNYGSNVLHCLAYNPANPAEKYSITPNVPLENRIGFYGVKVDLPMQETPHILTVGFVLSNDLLTQYAQNTSLYTLDFPAYPSLTTPAPLCNASIILPQNAKYINGTVAAFNYSKKDLPAFTYEPANVTFTLTGDKIQLLVINKLVREIKVDGVGEIQVSDSYYIKNQSPEEITYVDAVLPLNASTVTAEDEFGRKAKTPTLVDAEINCYRVSLVLPVKSGGSAMFAVRYTLPRTIYLKQNGSHILEFSFTAFKDVNYYIERVYITFVLPEGAKMMTLNYDGDSTNSAYSMWREVFQEKVAVSRQGVFFLENFTVNIVYQYNPLWLSFRPTLWVWVLASFVCAVAVIVKRPKAPAPVIVPAMAVRFRPEVIRSFVSSHEEKRKIILEIEALEAGVRRGRIPRRRYKVQKKTLETRLSTLTRNLDDLKQKLWGAGGRYADLMRQLEVAEAEINEVEANIRSIETRHRRGELSLEAYRKLLRDYERRKGDAETRINGILVRLREEMR